MTPNNGWNAIWENSGQRLAKGGDLPIWVIVLAAGLFAIAAGIALHTYLSGRGKQFSLRGTASQLSGMLWLVPIVVIVLAVMLPTMTRIESVPHEPHHQHDDHGDDADLGQPTEMITAEVPVGMHTAELSTERPAWVDAGAADNGERKRIVVQGRQYSEVSEAKQDALQAAAKLVKDDFAHNQNATGNWQLANSLVQSVAIKDTYVERIERRTELNEFAVYRAYHLVELSPEVREAVFTAWRSQVVDHRVWLLGGLFSFVALVLGTTATYLRIDALTDGKYRGRLKLASLSLVAAGGLGLSSVLPLLPIA